MRSSRTIRTHGTTGLVRITGHLGCSKTMDEAELFHQIARVEDRERTITNQPVRTLRCLPTDVPRHGEDGNAVLGCLHSGDQSPTGDTSLNNNNCTGEPRDDPVPRRKPPTAARNPGRQTANPVSNTIGNRTRPSSLRNRDGCSRPVRPRH